MYLNLVFKVLWFVLFHSVQTPYYDQSMSEIQIALFCSNTVSSLNKKKQVTRSFQVVPTDVHIISIKPFQTANFLSRKTFIICLKISPVLTIRISVALFMIIKYCLFLVTLLPLWVKIIQTCDIMILVIVEVLKSRTAVYWIYFMVYPQEVSPVSNIFFKFKVETHQ